MSFDKLIESRLRSHGMTEKEYKSLNEVERDVLWGLCLAKGKYVSKADLIVDHIDRPELSSVTQSAYLSKALKGIKNKIGETIVLTKYRAGHAFGWHNLGPSQI